MNCSNVRPFISAYYDGDVSAEERIQVEGHLEGCQACRRVLAEFRAIGGGISSLAMPRPPAGLRRDVWRAIEAQQTKPGVFRGAPSRGVVTSLPQPKERSVLPGWLMGASRSWAAAVPAGILIGGLLLVLSVILLRNNPVSVASIVGGDEVSSFAQPVLVQLSKDVIEEDCINNTFVRFMQGSEPITLTNGVEVVLSYNQPAKQIVLQPKPQWQAGASYEVYIDAPKIGVRGAGKLDSAPIPLSFSVAANTPTPTSTPTITPTPTNTPAPPTKAPPTQAPPQTAIAEVTAAPTQGQVIGVPTNVPTQAMQPSATPRPLISPTTAAQPSSTPRSDPTNTAAIPPTNTPVQPAPTNTAAPEPTRTMPPTSTPVASATTRQTPPAPTSTVAATVTATATAVPRKGTPTATSTPRPVTSPTATPVNSGPCELTPVRGFGKIWQANRAVRDKIGCADATEMAIPQAAVQRFQGGTMVWRADLKLIYVFVHGANDPSGTWLQFQDTWHDTDTAPKSTATPPAGFYEPVRGFGKLWNSNSYLRQALGWGVEQEVALTAAWQPFERGEALWTSARQIYFMYTDGTFGRFEDTFSGEYE